MKEAQNDVDDALRNFDDRMKVGQEAENDEVEYSIGQKAGTKSDDPRRYWRVDWTAIDGLDSRN